MLFAFWNFFVNFYNSCYGVTYFLHWHIFTFWNIFAFQYYILFYKGKYICWFEYIWCIENLSSSIKSRDISFFAVPSYSVTFVLFGIYAFDCVRYTVTFISFITYRVCLFWLPCLLLGDIVCCVIIYGFYLDLYFVFSLRNIFALWVTL